MFHTCNIKEAKSPERDGVVLSQSNGAYAEFMGEILERPSLPHNK